MKPNPVQSSLHTLLPHLLPRATRRLPPLMTGIKDIQLIGDEVAIRWNDGAETFYKMDRLRSLSPSAETMGERDLLGKNSAATKRAAISSGTTVTG